MTRFVSAGISQELQMSSAACTSLQAQQEDAAATAAAVAALQQLPPAPSQLQQPADIPADTLVIYIYNEDDPAYPSNFQHFISFAVQPNSRCKYVVLVQERSLHSAVELPSVPGLQYIYYAGPCYEWGMVGWLLSARHQQAAQHSVAAVQVLHVFEHQQYEAPTCPPTCSTPCTGRSPSSGRGRHDAAQQQQD